MRIVTYLSCLSFGLQSLGGSFLVKHLLEMFVFNGLRLDTFTFNLQLNAFSTGRVINAPGTQTAVESWARGKERELRKQITRRADDIASGLSGKTQGSSEWRGGLVTVDRICQGRNTAQREP